MKNFKSCNYVFLHSSMVEAMPVRLTSLFRSPCHTEQWRRSHIFNWIGACPSKNREDVDQSLNRKKLLSSQMHFSDGSDGEMKRALLLKKRPPVQPLSVHMPENAVKVSAIYQLQSKEVSTKHTQTSCMPDRWVHRILHAALNDYLYKPQVQQEIRIQTGSCKSAISFWNYG